MNDHDFSLVQKLSLPSYDNGEVFTERARLEIILKLAKDTPYTTCIEENRFVLFAKKPINSLSEQLIVISSHIDADEELTDFFAEIVDDKTIRGTFDNTLTNAVALSLMMEGSLPDNVIFAFTANEEQDGLGASDVSEYLKKAGKKFFALVLDVTDIGYKKVHHTIENDFWKSKRYDSAIREVLYSSEPYRFVCSGATAPHYVPYSYIERSSDGGVFEALCDESWTYDDNGIECLSLCIPIEGDMHDNYGVLCRSESFAHYKNFVHVFASRLAIA